MNCPKCGFENNDNMKFCCNCGKKLKNNYNPHFTDFKSKIITLNRKRIITIGICSCIIITIITICMFLNNPIHKFKTAINNNQVDAAKTIYDSDIKQDEKLKAKLETYLKKELINIEKNFKDDKIDFSTAKNKLENYLNLNILTLEINSSIKNINSLNNSKNAFIKAEEFLKTDDYLNAIKEYSQVIQDDSNYDAAQKKIEDNKDKFKELVFTQTEEYIGNNDYGNAVQLLTQAKEIVTNDNDILNKLDIYSEKLKEIKEQQKQEKIKQDEANQLLVVDNATILVQDSKHKALYPDMLQAFVTNKSDKTVKDMNIGFLAYDQNGYPLKIKTQFSFNNANFNFIGNADNINLIPGAQFGAGMGWRLDDPHGISTVKACVKDATFYDGTSWSNPYYSYWYEQYNEKPLN